MNKFNNLKTRKNLHKSFYNLCNDDYLAYILMEAYIKNNKEVDLDKFYKENYTLTNVLRNFYNINSTDELLSNLKNNKKIFDNLLFYSLFYLKANPELIIDKEAFKDIFEENTLCLYNKKINPTHLDLSDYINENWLGDWDNTGALDKISFNQETRENFITIYDKFEDYIDSESDSECNIDVSVGLISLTDEAVLQEYESQKDANYFGSEQDFVKFLKDLTVVNEDRDEIDVSSFNVNLENLRKTKDINYKFTIDE